MSKYLVKLEELEEKNNNMEDLIQIIENSIMNMEKELLNMKWEGIAKERFLLSYNNYLEELKLINSNLKTSLNITNEFCSNYNEGFEKIKSGFKKLENEVKSDDKKRYSSISTKH